MKPEKLVVTLQAQQAVCLPDRIEMRKRGKRRGRGRTGMYWGCIPLLSLEECRALGPPATA